MTNSGEWTRVWERDLEAYLCSPPRLGIFIRNHFGNELKNVLEIGCGSARDSLFLAKQGIKVLATDYDEYVIKQLQAKFSNVENISFMAANAFNISQKIEDKFDLTFHNGLIIYLNDNEIISILRQEYLITKRYMLIVCHNKKNKLLIKKFNNKRNCEKLFDIRFFTNNEVVSLVEKALGKNAKNITVLKFGHRYLDLLFHMCKMCDSYLICGKVIFKFYSLLPWSSIERIAVVVEV